MKKVWMFVLALLVFFGLSGPVEAKKNKVKPRKAKTEMPADVVPVPEPSSALLLLSGLLGAAGWRRRAKKI
ncbi:MAG: PEP-CTERM sorting domain-containing protein [Desulfobacteraceae bacterium]|nr:MAG: PEP-CTERM sorting domain-containing protein [Desulfobacteraceae bacterium]